MDRHRHYHDYSRNLAGVRSRFHVAGHPLHPMFITFPSALFTSTLVTDIVYWWLREPFWAEMSFWLLVGGIAGGSAAAFAGFMDFMLVRHIRRHVTSWSHMLVAILLMAIATANLLLRWADPAAQLIPVGLAMSGLMMIVLFIAGWLGGKLVFEHNIGPGDSEA